MPDSIPQHPNQQTTLVAKIAEKKNVFEPWKNMPCACVHCGKMFPSNAAKNSHLMHCKFRTLSRYFKLGSKKGEAYLFTIQFNPIKRRRNALQKLINDFKDSKMLLGAIAIWINEGVVRNYAVLSLEESTHMMAYPDGRVLFNMIKKLLTEKELKLLEAQVSVLNDEKNKLREEAGIKL
jgi:hypothetical protein